MKKYIILSSLLITSLSSLYAVEIFQFVSQARKKINEGDKIANLINVTNNSLKNTTNAQTRKNILNKIQNLKKSALSNYQEALSFFDEADKLPGLIKNQTFFINKQKEDIEKKIDTVNAI